MMKRKSGSKTRRKAGVLLAILLLPLTITANNVFYTKPVSIKVIAHPKTAPKSLTLAKLRAIFRGEKQWWANRVKIKIALMKTSTKTGKVTAEKVYGMTADELNRFWVEKVFRGETKAPKSFRSEEDLLDFVASTPGAIAVVSSSAVDTLVTLLSIDGKTAW